MTSATAVAEKLDPAVEAAESESALAPRRESCCQGCVGDPHCAEFARLRLGRDLTNVRTRVPWFLHRPIAVE